MEAAILDYWPYLTATVTVSSVVVLTSRMVLSAVLPQLSWVT